MAYSTSNPPFLKSQGIGAGRTWGYESTDNAAAVRVAGYFTNGWKLGMRANDRVEVVDTDASPPAVTSHVVVSASASAGVDLDDGVAVSGSDSD